MKVSPEETVYVAHRSEPGSTSFLAVDELVTHLRMAGIPAEPAEDKVPGFVNFLIGTGWDEMTDRKVASMGADGICIRDIGNQSLLLTGKGARGALNAIYSFLEDHMGFVWFNASETHVPSRGFWNFGGLDVSYTPPFELRCIGAAAARDYKWCARKRLNFFTDDPPANEPLLADCFTFAGKHCHNVYKLLSLGYFGTREDPLALFENQELIRELHAIHPEYFALYKGSRDPYPGDIPGADLSEQCGNISLTNDNVVELLVKGARLLLQHHPAAKLISLSLRDNYHYCEEAKASPGGVAGAMLRMVNAFAESLCTTHPEIRIDIIAYHGTQKPPESGKLHPAVTVRYCPIRVSQYHAFDESEHNLRGGLNYETPRAMSQPVEQIRQWRSIADRVVVWYYALNLPYFQPHPSLRAHDRTFRKLQQLGVSGVYIQDNKPMDWNVFNDLRVHLLTRLLWDPALDANAETRRFCELYYGPAASQVLAYIDLLHEESVWDWENWVEADGVCKWERDGCEESWDWFGEVPDNAYPKPHFYTLYHTRPPLKADFFVRGKPLLDQALDAIRGQESYESRIDEWRMSFYYGVLSSSCAGEDLEREARDWFIPRFDRLRRECEGKGFDGLDTLGLSIPKPVLPADCNPAVIPG
jgi:hypothetical protein